MPADFCLAGQKIHSPIHTRRDIKQALGQNLELIRQTVLKVGLLELLNKLMAVDVVVGESRHKAQDGGQMSLAHAGRTSSEEIPLRPRLRRGLRPLYSFLLSPRGPLRWARAGALFTFSAFSRKRMVANSSIWRLSMEGWKEKSKSSKVFLMGKPDI